jgi:hypothetical protein
MVSSLWQLRTGDQVASSKLSGILVGWNVFVQRRPNEQMALAAGTKSDVAFMGNTNPLNKWKKQLRHDWDKGIFSHGLSLRPWR